MWQLLEMRFALLWLHRVRIFLILPNGRAFRLPGWLPQDYDPKLRFNAAHDWCWLSEPKMASRSFPTNNGGTVGDRKGFHHLNDHAGVADIGCSTERLGMMLNDILEKCS